MNVLSLFDGISCGQLAFKRAGVHVDKYYASEVCPYSIKIAKKNFPATIEIGDVRNIKADMFEEPIDILIGGSPCQSFSFMGKRNGASTKDNIEVITLEQYLELKEQGCEFDGYSYLFWEYVRLLKTVKPKYFLLENVKMSQHWKSVITKTLGIEPVLINSKDFSAQNRERLYWTNIPLSEIVPKHMTIGDIVEPIDNKLDFEITDKVNKYIYSHEYDGRKIQKCVKAKIRDMNGISKCLGTGCGCYGNNTGLITRYNNRYFSITPTEAERLQTLPDGYTAGTSSTNRFFAIGNGWTVDVIAYIFKNLTNEFKEEN